MARGFKGARSFAIFAALSMALILGAGPTLAKTFTCPEDESCTGTKKADTITGEGSNTFDGKRGNDTLLSRGESALTGGDGNDTLEEKDGVDQGGETLVGSNLLYGGSGDDKILVRFGASAVSAGGGNDVIWAKNDVRDIINCGADQDTVTFDQGLDDVENNCEEQNS